MTAAVPSRAGPAPAWAERCERCGRNFPLLAPVWRCGCGGLLGLVGPAPTRLVGDPDRWSLWRYAPTLPPIDGWQDVSLGEGMTPVVPLGDGVVAKVDYLNPTLSFKDRGAAVLVAAMAARGVRRAVIDSSGNAGTAMAAYASRAGIDLEVFVPGGTSPVKTAAMRAHDADVRIVDGDRAAAASAAVIRVEATGAFYASHVYQPLFAQGVKTVVLEMWEQLGGVLPEVLVLPVGNGTLVLGADLALDDLASLGLLGRVPRIVAVQARRCAPLAGLAPDGPTVAEGIAIAAPPRAEAIVGVVARRGGEIVTVTEESIVDARRDLAGRGLWVEPTAAVGWAAWRDGSVATPGTSVAVILCGAGLKAG